MTKIYSTDWQMVRLKKTTWEKLKVLKACFDAAYHEGKIEGIEYNDRHGITLDAIIDALIERDLAHRVRGRKKRSPKAWTNPETTNA